jgi:pyruvate ferredoxin oxidoreductase beta subunit
VPCPPGWGYDSSKTVELAKRAVETGCWNLYEIEDGKTNFTFKPRERKPVSEYLKGQKRFKHLTEEDIAQIQKHVDEKISNF